MSGVHAQVSFHFKGYSTNTQNVILNDTSKILERLLVRVALKVILEVTPKIALRVILKVALKVHNIIRYYKHTRCLRSHAGFI